MVTETWNLKFFSNTTVLTEVNSITMLLIFDCERIKCLEFVYITTLYENVLHVVKVCVMNNGPIFMLSVDPQGLKKDSCDMILNYLNKYLWLKQTLM